MYISLVSSTEGFQSASLIGIGSIGWTEGLLIAFLLLMLFGARRLPETAQSLGKAIREFKKSLTAPEEEPKVTSGDRDVAKVEAPKRDETN